MDAETRAALEWAYDYAATMTLAADHPTDKKLFSSYARTLQGLLDGEKGGDGPGKRSQAGMLLPRVHSECLSVAGAASTAPPDVEALGARRLRECDVCGKEMMPGGTICRKCIVEMDTRGLTASERCSWCKRAFIPTPDGDSFTESGVWTKDGAFHMDPCYALWLQHRSLTASEREVVREEVENLRILRAFDGAWGDPEDATLDDIIAALAPIAELKP